MKKLIYLLPIMVFMFMAMVNTSCNDDLLPDDPEEEELVMPTDTNCYHLKGVLPGVAVYDTVYNCLSIQIDTDLKKIINGFWLWDTLMVENVRFIPDNIIQSDFDVIPNSRFFFQIYGLSSEMKHYSSATKTGYFFISIRDNTESRSNI